MANRSLPTDGVAVNPPCRYCGSPTVYRPEFSTDGVFECVECCALLDAKPLLEEHGGTRKEEARATCPAAPHSYPHPLRYHRAGVYNPLLDLLPDEEVI